MDTNAADYCCDEFRRAVEELNVMPWKKDAYPENWRPSGQFEQLDDGTWAINGCCGGGCFVVSGVKFCPFCGASLRTDEEAFRDIQENVKIHLDISDEDREQLEKHRKMQTKLYNAVINGGEDGNITE